MSDMTRATFWNNACAENYVEKRNRQAKEQFEDIGFRDRSIYRVWKSNITELALARNGAIYYYVPRKETKLSKDKLEKNWVKIRPEEEKVEEEKAEEEKDNNKNKGEQSLGLKKLTSFTSNLLLESRPEVEGSSTSKSLVIQGCQSPEGEIPRDSTCSSLEPKDSPKICSSFGLPTKEQVENGIDKVEDPHKKEDESEGEEEEETEEEESAFDIRAIMKRRNKFEQLTEKAQAKRQSKMRSRESFEEIDSLEDLLKKEKEHPNSFKKEREDFHCPDNFPAKIWTALCMWDENQDDLPPVEVLAWNGEGERIKKGEFPIYMGKRNYCEYFGLSYEQVQNITEEYLALQEIKNQNDDTSGNEEEEEEEDIVNNEKAVVPIIEKEGKKVEEKKFKNGKEMNSSDLEEDPEEWWKLDDEEEKELKKLEKEKEKKLKQKLYQKNYREKKKLEKLNKTQKEERNNLEEELEIINQVGQIEGEPHQIVTTPKALALGCCLVTKLSKTLEEAGEFTEYNETLGANQTLYSFSDKLFNCGEFYSESNISYKEDLTFSVWWPILTIIAAIVFVLVIDSYWPMLWSMFKTIRGIDKKLDDKQNKSFELTIQNPMDSVVGNPVAVMKTREEYGVNKWLIIWIFLCIIASFVAALLLAVGILTVIKQSYEPEEKQLCVEVTKLEDTSSRRKLKNSEDESNLIQIISQSDSSTTLSMPCDSELYDELGNIWKVEGPYELVCENETTFNYTTLRHSHRWVKCCGYPKVDDNSDGKFKSVNAPGIEGKEDTPGECGPCKEWFRHRYYCDQVPVKLNYCYYVDKGGTFVSLNGVSSDSWGSNRSVVPSMAVSPILQAPYGFWRNETSVILAQADNMYLEGTNFNFTCKPLNSPRATTKYIWAEPRTVSPLPHLISCQVLLTVNFVVDKLVSDYCTSVLAVINTETGAFGFKTNGITECTIKVADSSGFKFYKSISDGSYTFFKDIAKIGCILQEDGVYVNCSNMVDLNDIEPKEMGYDVTSKLISGSGGGASDYAGIDSFSTGFGSNVFTVIIIVIIIIVVIVAAVIGICIIRYVCNRRKQSQSDS
jgi:hypothetical protein